MGHSNNLYKFLGVLRNVNLTAGVGVDLGYISINPNKRYHGISLHVISTVAAGSLAVATVGAYSAANAGGTNVVGNTTLTSLVTVNAMQIISPTSASSFTSDSIYVRLSAIALNSGNADVYIYGYEEAL